MRKTAIAIFVCLLAARSALAADVPATSRIDLVTVFPAGAEVTRVAKVKLDSGEHVVVFGDLPAAADTGSIRVEGKATGKLEIGSVDALRLFVPRADAVIVDAERKRIEDELEKLRDERAILDGQVQAAEQQKALIANLTQLPSRPAPEGGNADATPREDWRELLGLIASGTVDATRAALDAQVKIREADRKIEELTKKLGEIAPKREERTEVRVFVSADTVLDADLILRYQVPDASWAPFYDARLATGTKEAAPRLQLTRRAAVSQRTGESWDEVLLALSTSRPSAGSSAPELYPMTVDFELEAKPVDTARQSRGPYPMAAPSPAPPPDGFAGGIAAEADIAAAPPEMAEIEQKQATVTNAPFQALFAVPGRLSVPSTGEEKRVELQEDGLDPALVVRTVPKLDAKAYLYAKLTMPKGSPLLSGAVSLFRDGTFVGTGQLPILASGEEHELGFGVDDLVRVRHAVVEEKRGETGLISSVRTDDRNFRITAKNLHERAVELLVLDQMPASQNEAIKVEVTGRSAPSKRDWKEKRGVLAWETKLEPDEEKTIEFGYRVTWPAAKRIVYGP